MRSVLWLVGRTYEVGSSMSFSSLVIWVYNHFAGAVRCCARPAVESLRQGCDSTEDRPFNRNLGFTFCVSRCWYLWLALDRFSGVNLGITDCALPSFLYIGTQDWYIILVLNDLEWVVSSWKDWCVCLFGTLVCWKNGITVLSTRIMQLFGLNLFS